MPIVLTQNAETADGHAYDDVLGERYEYPPRYASLVRTGERFVYYRGRRGAPPGEANTYVGAGIVDELGPSARTPGRLTAALVGFRPFESPVGFKTADGYLENIPTGAGSMTGRHFRGTSVRPIDETRYARILSLGSMPGSPAISGLTSGRAPVYPDPAAAAAVDRVGMSLAPALAASRFPGCEIVPMAQNNPGFDLLVLREGATHAFVEVKSTMGSPPDFFLSETERRHSQIHGDASHLLVIVDVDLVEGTGRPMWHAGPMEPPEVELEPRQWRARLVVPGLATEEPA